MTLLAEPAAHLIESTDVLAETALLQRGEVLVAGGRGQPVSNVLEHVNKALVRLSEGSELLVNVRGDGRGSSRFVVHGMRESQFLPQGVVLLRDDQQRNRLPEETVGQIFGFTRPASDEGAVLYTLIGAQPGSGRPPGALIRCPWYRAEQPLRQRRPGDRCPRD